MHFKLRYFRIWYLISPFINGLFWFKDRFREDLPFDAKHQQSVLVRQLWRDSHEHVEIDILLDRYKFYARLYSRPVL